MPGWKKMFGVGAAIGAGSGILIGGGYGLLAGSPEVSSHQGCDDGIMDRHVLSKGAGDIIHYDSDICLFNNVKNGKEFIQQMDALVTGLIDKSGLEQLDKKTCKSHIKKSHNINDVTGTTTVVYDLSSLGDIDFNYEGDKLVAKSNACKNNGKGHSCGAKIGMPNDLASIGINIDYSEQNILKLTHHPEQDRGRSSSTCGKKVRDGSAIGGLAGTLLGGVIGGVSAEIHRRHTQNNPDHRGSFVELVEGQRQHDNHQGEGIGHSM